MNLPSLYSPRVLVFVTLWMTASHAAQATPPVAATNPAQTTVQAAASHVITHKSVGAALDALGELSCVLSDDLDYDDIPDVIAMGKNGIIVNRHQVLWPKDSNFERTYGCKLVDFNPDIIGKQIIFFTSDTAVKYWYIWRIDNDIPSYVGLTEGGSFSLDSGILKMSTKHCGITKESRYTIKGNSLVHLGDKSHGKYDETDCAACPYVYAFVDGSWVFVGEILRNLSNPSLEGRQSLALPKGAIHNGRVRIRLREVKNETTYLDDIYLTVDGQRVAPAACTGSYCSDDQNYEVFSLGEYRDLDFETTANGELMLWADGYYVPH